MSEYKKIIIESNPNIIIYKNPNGNRKMQFNIETDIINNVYQSIYNIYDIDMFILDYMFFMILLFEYVEKHDSFLMIGLGGGHLPMFIKSKINAYIKVIEIDNNVLNGAREMGYNLDNVIIENGIDYIKKSNMKYDVIIIDLDCEESILKFDIENITKIMNENSLLVINSYSKNSILKPILKQYFRLIKRFVIDNNNIFFAQKNTNMFIKMLNEITLETLENNNVLQHYKYKEEMLRTIKKSKVSITIN